MFRNDETITWNEMTMKEVTEYPFSRSPHTLIILGDYSWL